MISYIMGLLLFGGFYDFSVLATAVCVVAEIIVHYYKKKPVYQKKKNYILWIPTFMVIWSMVVSYWALDVSENILGIMRGVTMLLWMYRCFLMSEEEKKKCFVITPYLGAAMVVVGMVSLINEQSASFFWQARRFGGFFQYSNTCALFLLLGIVILVQQFNLRNTAKIGKISKSADSTVIKKHIMNFVVTGLLLAGIFMTGSRSVLLLLAGWGVYTAVRIKKLRIPVLLIIMGSFGIAYAYGLIAGDTQNIARIFTLFSSNSTILGRVLYDIDALSLALKYPLGLGYMGYYYMQPAVQTGVYTTMFVHNDFLQLLVDYGFVALSAGLIYLGYQVLRGKQDAQKKELLILILMAVFVDFHLQYMSIFMFLILCLDLGEKGGLKKRKELRENYIFCGITLIAAGYFTIAFGTHYLGNDSVALAMFPGYTKAQTEALNMCTDKESAVSLADNILTHNEYISEAYHVKVYAAAMDKEYMKAMEYMDKSLAIRRYDVETYRAYDELLTEMIRNCNEMGRTEDVEALTEYKNNLPKMLADIEAKTHPIAFKLRDVPVFIW